MTYKNSSSVTYGDALRQGFHYLLKNYGEVVILGQGLWSPWYVGNSLKNLDKEFGRERVIDSPVSEAACSSAGIGASLAGMRPIIVHPRMDFMLYAMDAIVNQAAKWSQMFGGNAHCGVTFRGIINRGGEQGAQHSQALQAWFCHVPGLRVVMPASVQDARDLLVSSVLCDDPVVFVDDRWLYDQAEEIGALKKINLANEGPKVITSGEDVTIVASGYSVLLAKEAARTLSKHRVSVEVIDLRILNPIHPKTIIESVKKTGALIVVDGGWAPCGVSAEIIALVSEGLPLGIMKALPKRITIPFAPAPTSTALELKYYPSVDQISKEVIKICEKASS